MEKQRVSRVTITGLTMMLITRARKEMTKANRFVGIATPMAASLLLISSPIKGATEYKQNCAGIHKSSIGTSVRNPTDKANLGIVRLEDILAKRRFTNGGLQERVRIYAYYRDETRHLVVGVLALPTWHGKKFNKNYSEPRDPTTWQAGYYAVPLEFMPSKVSYLPDISCSFITIEYDVEHNILRPNRCID